MEKDILTRMGATMKLMQSEAGYLRSIVERIERIEGERAELAQDIRDILREAKGEGFEPKIIRKVIALRKRADRTEDQIVEAYMRALEGTPLGDWADNKTEERIAQ